MEATRTVLSDGRWHFQHGPIDLILGADGESMAVSRAFERAWRRFGEVLPELVCELPLLRRPVRDVFSLRGRVAQRMFNACWLHRQIFITPMAAVAGAVADELIEYFRDESGIVRAYINNGGDIALHLQHGQRYRVGLFADIGRFAGKAMPLDGDFDLEAGLPVRGIATSGWRGRSFSLGIADSVSVFAESAAAADAAATVIANQVDAEHAAIVRAPANSVKDDTDLGDLLVTVDVGILPATVVGQALERGAAQAERLLRGGVIDGAVIVLQGQTRVLGLQELDRRLLQVA